MEFNRTLAKARKCNESALEGVYQKLGEILRQPFVHCQSPQEAVKVVEGVEYTLQLLWGFSVDKNFHNYWHSLKGCTCPKLDNRELSGVKWNIYDTECPHHGVNPAESWSDKRLRG